MDRRFRWLPLLTFVGVLFSPSLATSGPKDTAAAKLADDAINNDYLATNFSDAEKKLRSALAMCKGNACSAQTRARLHRDLGVVLVAGLNRAEDGKKEFGEALKEDPNIALEKDLTTPEVDKAFQAAKGGGGGDAPAAPAAATPAAASGDMVHTPAAEQAVLTPVPIYVELADGMNPTKVVVKYKAFGAPDWKTLELRKMTTGYGAEIPCLEVGSATGDLVYYIQAIDGSGDVISASGTRNAPNKVAIKNELSGEPPHLPGKPPSAQCRDKADCPPGFPGCTPKRRKGGNKSWGDACENDNECGEGLACKAGQCEGGEKKDDPQTDQACEADSDCAEGESCGADKVCEGAGGTLKKLWISAQLQPDFSIVGGQDNVCGNYEAQPPNNVKCYGEDGFVYEGIPDAGVAGAKKGNAVNGGPHFATTRLLLGLDYLLGSNVALGLRVGYAFGVAPGRSTSALHAEARATYWLGKRPFRKKAVRPFVALVGGMAEIDDKFMVPIHECTTKQCLDTKMNTGLRTDYPVTQEVTAWRKAGGTFAGLAGGVMIPVGPTHGVLAELKILGLFPNAGFAVSPSIGYALGL